MNLYVRYNTERDRKQWVSWIQQTSRRQATEQVPLHPPRCSTPQAGRVRLPPGTGLLDNSAGWAARLPQGTPAGYRVHPLHKGVRRLPQGTTPSAGHPPVA